MSRQQVKEPPRWTTQMGRHALRARDLYQTTEGSHRPDSALGHVHDCGYTITGLYPQALRTGLA